MAFGGVGEVEFVPVPVPAVEPFWYPAGVEPGSLGAPGVTGVIARWKHCSWRAASSVGSSDPAHLASRGMWSRRALRQAGS